MPDFTVKIQATRTEYLEVEVSKRDLFEKAVALVKRTVIPNGIPSDAYINDRGEWEDWEDGHGSGFTTRHRPATEAEAREFQIVREFEQLVREKVLK